MLICAVARFFFLFLYFFPLNSSGGSSPRKSIKSYHCTFKGLKCTSNMAFLTLLCTIAVFVSVVVLCVGLFLELSGG